MAENRNSGEQVNLPSPQNRISIPIWYREIFVFKVWQLTGLFSKPLLIFWNFFFTEIVSSTLPAMISIWIITKNVL